MLWRTRALVLLVLLAIAGIVFWSGSRIEFDVLTFLDWGKIAGIIVAVGLSVWFFIWALFFAPRVKPRIDGRLVITNPNGDIYEPYDLYGFGSRVTIGSEGQIVLDPSLDSDVVGVVGEIRARVEGKRTIVRSVWKRGPSGQLEGHGDIYHNDEFWLGRHRVRYENTAAERSH